MNPQIRLSLLKSRAKLLESRGPHNTKIVNKIKREIRKLEKDS